MRGVQSHLMKASVSKAVVRLKKSQNLLILKEIKIKKSILQIKSEISLFNQRIQE